MNLVGNWKRHSASSFVFIRRILLFVFYISKYDLNSKPNEERNTCIHKQNDDEKRFIRALNFRFVSQAKFFELVAFDAIKLLFLFFFWCDEKREKNFYSIS